MSEITFKVLGPAGDRPVTYPADPDGLELAAGALKDFLARGNTALVPGEGQITRIDPEKVPGEVLILGPLVGG